MACFISGWRNSIFSVEQKQFSSLLFRSDAKLETFAITNPFVISWGLEPHLLESGYYVGSLVWLLLTFLALVVWKEIWKCVLNITNAVTSAWASTHPATKVSCRAICSKFIKTMLTPRLTYEGSPALPMESLHRTRCFYSYSERFVLSPQLTH